MKAKCQGTKKNGEPCTAWAMANGYCRRHGGAVVADQETSEVEEEEESTAAEKMPVEPEICGALTGKGNQCKLRVVVNGRCRRHQGVSDMADETVIESEEEVAESSMSEDAVEANEPQGEKPASKKRKQKSRKRKPKTCGALTAKGTPCTFKVSAHGRCGKHQGAPDVQSEAFLKSTPARENDENAGDLKYGAYINSLIDQEEVAIFEEYYQLLHNDFTLNNSSDRMNCEIACLYYIKLLKSLKNNDTESASSLDQLLRNKLQDLRDNKKS
ncbi:MAG: DUF5763 domain-containing protein [Nitrospinota bacterium]